MELLTMTVRGMQMDISALVTAAVVAASPTPADYQGTYENGIDGPVEIVSSERIFAVVMDAKYPLTQVGPDQLRNATGQLIPFKRENGKLVGYTQDGVFHRRLSDSISPASAALARPRPIGSDNPQAYRYGPPADLHDGIPVGDIANTVLGRETATRIVHGILDGTWADVHSILLYQDGRLVLEEYFYGYNIDRPHQLRSATKSVVSAVAGSAVLAGALDGADEPVLARMRYASYANPDLRKRRMTLGDLLTMRSGLDCDDHSGTSPGRETVIDEQPDWVKATLDLPMLSIPGTEGHYCSGAVGVAGRLTENATGQTLPEYAQAHLFGPLGIRRQDWHWNYTLSKENREYSQIHLRPRDMLKLGILYANNGMWQGKRVLPAEWVHASLNAQSKVDGTDYGYFWWRPWIRVNTLAGEQRVTYNAAQGNGGQKIYLFPKLGLVAVMTAGAYNSQTPSNPLIASAVLPTLLSASEER
jgi:CubicO group peptidase (beta-lactamase class C family)